MDKQEINNRLDNNIEWVSKNFSIGSRVINGDFSDAVKETVVLNLALLDTISQTAIKMSFTGDATEDFINTYDEAIANYKTLIEGVVDMSSL